MTYTSISANTGEASSRSESPSCGIEDSGSDSDLSGSNGKEELRNVFVAATSYRMKNLGDEGADPGEKRLEGSADRITMNKSCTHCDS